MKMDVTKTGLLVLALGAALATSACSGEDTDQTNNSAGEPDAAVSADVGADAAPEPDAGPADVGPQDVGVDAEADVAPDAAPQPDVGVDASTPDAAPQPDTGPVGWQAPTCAEIYGHEGVTWTTDEGATLKPTRYTLGGLKYTTGLATLPIPGHILAVTNESLYRSTDAGCTWNFVQHLDANANFYQITAGVEERAYIWSQNGKALYRVDAKGVTDLKLPEVPSPNPDIDFEEISVLGLGTDPAQPDAVRVAGKDGQLYESSDAGASWRAIGAAPGVGNAMGYIVAFDPNDFEHAVMGAASTGAWTTTDGGQTWQQATGLGAGAANLFNVQIAPSDSNVVWGVGLDIEENVANNTSTQGRYIYRSEDGGQTFLKAFGRTSDVTLVNSQTIGAHPTDSDVLYFAWGSCAAGPGVNLYRYDATTRQVTWQNTKVYDRFSALAFNPADPNVIYVGASTERAAHACPTP